MIDKDKKCCGNCTYWQNYQEGIRARISGAYNNIMSRGLIELRPCSWSAHPSINTVCQPIHTDEKFRCPEFRRE
ncbi:hypothetical protein LCGC14_1408950 [marine sediment metagenome]|uniref:Uncharacterized protein n=1 Tax=marine sediment metagenome TaxID=412755 RepID=A0A0F9KFS1_9ZZZZ